MADLKFKLTSETKVNIFGYKLFRIEATATFKNGGQEIAAGQKGGWIDTEKLENGNARVSGNAWVSDEAQVFGNARVSGNAWVSDEARVSGNARVSDEARVSGNAWVSGNARVSGNAWVSAKKNFTKGWFVAADDDDQPKKLTVLHGEVDQDADSPYWANTYVLGDYEITDIKPSEPDEPEIIERNGKRYKRIS